MQNLEDWTAEMGKCSNKIVLYNKIFESELRQFPSFVLNDLTDNKPRESVNQMSTLLKRCWTDTNILNWNIANTEQSATSKKGLPVQKVGISQSLNALVNPKHWFKIMTLLSCPINTCVFFILHVELWGLLKYTEEICERFCSLNLSCWCNMNNCVKMKLGGSSCNHYKPYVIYQLLLLWEGEGDSGGECKREKKRREKDGGARGG